MCSPYELCLHPSTGSGIEDTLLPIFFESTVNPSGIFRSPSRSSEYAINSDL